MRSTSSAQRYIREHSSHPCMHTGIFPRQLKLSRVKSIHKSGEQSHFCNYRPISLLPSMSKVFEYVILDQLITFLTDKKLFCKEQFGFRPGHSTELAALRLVDHLTTEMENSNVPTNIYIDLRRVSRGGPRGLPPPRN